ncbi:UNVERIFIED_CONTAM: NAD+ kinase [Acetivibrio alkalicellulosi]
MIKFGVVVNQQKDIDCKFTGILLNSIKKNKADYFLCDEAASHLGIEPKNIDEDTVINMADVIVCLGGDGSFLKTARMLFEKNTPIVGINLGSLGFLADVDKNNIDNAVKLLVNGQYEIEKRMLLETTIIRNNSIIAKDIVLNDVVISRGALSRILHLRTYINDKFMDMFPGDGLIIATPTGSTAYSLSAGGPIVEPDAELIVVTPICPHLLYSRSFISTGNRVIKVIVDENYCHEAMVTVDGQNGYEIRGGDFIITNRSSRFISTIKISNANFFEILRGKIHDRGERISKNEV